VTHTIFYSWQSDLPNNTNRRLIEQALESAAKAIRSDETLAIEPVIDRDTAGVAGSPEIATTLFDKIARSTVFVADISIINPGSRKRRTPNPNVLIETGFALHALGPERVLMILNSHYGAHADLPFDLKLRRVVTYSSGPDGTAHAEVRRALASHLETELRTILMKSGDAVTPAPASVSDSLRKAIRQGTGDRKLLARDYLNGFHDRLFALAPAPPPRDDEELVTSLAPSAPFVTEFGTICEAVAATGDVVVADAIYDSFGRVLARYSQSPSSGAYGDSEFDFYRFVGHELFVTFVAALLQERQLVTLKRLLDRDLELPPPHQERLRPFHELRRGVTLFSERSKRLNLMSAHGTLLRQRHMDGELGATVPFDHILGADYFLFLYAEAKHTDQRYVPWFPPTAPYLPETSTFLARLHRSDFATDVANAMGLVDSDELRRLIVGSETKLGRAFGIDWTRIPEAYNPALIGSR
jgi:hypothetical protein